jgi:RNA-directed DNA polymerase
MSPVTPDKIRSLQRKLYCKAKAEPAFRFYVLYDKICREDILLHAYKLARANAGAPGVDGVSFEQIEERGLEAWLAGLREELVSKTYRPDPVIPTNGEASVRSAFRPSVIVRFRPPPNSYWNPSSRSTSRTIRDVYRHLSRCYTDVVDADPSTYFDSIPHDDLLKSVARRVADGSVLRLIKLWLEAPIEERDGNGKRRMVGGKRNKRGTPQGGVATH